MRLPKDILSGESTKPQCFLCRPDKTIIGSVEFVNFCGTFKFNAFSEITGEMDRMYIDATTGQECINPLYDIMEALRLLYIPTYGYFQIQEAKITSDGIREYKEIFAYSLEYELSQKYLDLFVINQGTDESIDGVKILNQADASHSLLHLALDKMDNSWIVGHVDLSLQNLHRSFEIDHQTIYDFLVNDLAPSINAVIEFDSLNNTVNVYEEESACSDSNIYLSMDTLVNSLQVQYSADDIKTRLYVYGADDLNVRECNLGVEYITNMSYYQTPEWMGQELYDAYTAYCALTESYREQFAELMIEWSALYDQYSELYNKVPDYDDSYDDDTPVVYSKNDLPTASEKNVYQVYRVVEGEATWYYVCKSEVINGTTTYRWVLDVDNISSFYTFPTPSIEYVGGVYKVYNSDSTKGVLYYKCESYQQNDWTTGYRWVLAESSYGINLLKEKEQCYLDIQEVQVSAGYAEKTSDQYNRYLENYKKLTEIQTTIRQEEAKANQLKVQLDNNTAQRNIISEQIALEKNFTPEQIKNLNPFIREDEYTDDHFVVTELDDDASMLEVKKELLEAAQKELYKISQPQLSFSMDMANILAMPEFEPVLDNFEVGNNVNVEIRPGYVVKTQILEVDVNFDDMADFSVTFGNLSSLYSQTDIHSALLSQAVSAGKSVAESGSYWKKGADTANSIHSRIANGLIDANTSIKSTENQAISWDSHGLHLRKYANEEKTDYLDDQIWMNNEKIVFTDDNWESAKMAIGKFNDGILGEVYGIIAPNVVGTLLAGENLVIDSMKPDGTLSSFRVDSTGAKLYNSTFLMQKEYIDTSGENQLGQIMIDPSYGIVAGSNIYVTKSDGTVVPSFIDSNGNMIKDGAFPINSNFFLDADGGNAYFRGYVYAEDGYFTGTITSATVESATGNFSGNITATSGDIGDWIVKKGILYSTGSTSNEKNFVGLSSKYDYNEKTTDYAIWAGALSPTDAPFSVKRDGTLYATKGSFAGDISAATGTFKGSINVANNFVVDSSGNVTLSGNINMSGGNINWGNNSPKTNIYYLYSSSSNGANAHTDMRSTDYYRCDVIDDVQGPWYQFRGKNGSDADVPTYIKSTYIDSVTIKSPTIEANDFNVYPYDTNDNTGSFNIYGMYGTRQYHMLAIEYSGYVGYTPYTDFYSPQGGDIRFGYSTYGTSNENNFSFHGTVDFSEAEVSGLYLTFS